MARAGALLLALGAAASHAELDAALTIGTDYLHRGLTQNLSGPAYQAALEYQSDKGWFAGLWASRVDFEPYDDRWAEVDYYAGYGGRLGRNLAVEATVIRYDYQGSAPRDYDWQEVQLTAYLGDHWTVTGGLADNWWGADQTSAVAEATFRYPLPARLTLDATAGRHFSHRAIGIDYSYGQVGLSRPLGELVFRVAVAATDDDVREVLRPLTGERWLASLTWQP